MTTTTSGIEHNVSTDTRKLLIGGEWLEASSGKTFETIDPATGDLLAPVSYTHLMLPTNREV